MRDVKERFKEIRISNKLSQKEFAEKLGTSQGVISDIEHGRKGISRNVLLALGTEFNINATWVLTGEGDMFLPRQISAFKTAEQTINSVNEALIKNAESIDETITPPQELKQNAPAVPSQAFDIFRLRHGTTVTLAATETDFDALVLLPVFTQTAAGKGQPETQLQEIDKYIPIVLEMLGGANPRNCGIVRVVGDSMTDMNLFNGDFVIFDRTQIEGDGVYVISIGSDVRVKHLEYRPIERKIVISSENAKRYPNPEIISYEQAENILRIHGKVISWIHKHPY